MSNCIRFVKDIQRIVFRDEFFDVERFRKEVEAHGDHLQLKIKCLGQYTYDWFLTPKNCFFPLGNKACIIRLGEGNSSHTWRDFKHVLVELSKYMRPGKKMAYKFLVTDEFDNHRQVMSYMAVLPTTVEEQFPPYKPSNQKVTITRIR